MQKERQPGMQKERQPGTQMDRGASPVFVVGCHRSGTNLLYDTLLSAGGFAIYRGYLPLHKMLIPRFGTLENIRNRRNLVDAWMRSKGFRGSGLDPNKLTAQLMQGATSGGAFIRIVMSEIATAQNAPRWSVYDPDDVLYMRQIKSEIPNALFVHIVRDGRDVALSLRKMGEFRPFPWNRKPAGLDGTALYWKWMVENGRRQGKLIPEDYLEIKFEELVAEPRSVMGTLSAFLGQELDYEKINATRLGRLQDSNSSFTSEDRRNPVNRWKEKLTSAEIMSIEALVGDCLEESGYQIATRSKEKKSHISQTVMKSFYSVFLDVKRWTKIHTPAGRFSSLAALEILDQDPIAAGKN